MHTLRDAALLLDAANEAGGLEGIAASLGFSEPALELDDDGRNRLGLPPALGPVRVAGGDGALRALLIHAPRDVSLRRTITAVAAALAARTSHVLWLVIATGGEGEVALACWTAAHRPPRVLTLLVRRGHIVASDAETLSALAASRDGVDLLVHTRWCELLGRDSLSRRFYRTLEQRVGALAASLTKVTADDAAEMALLVTSRLLFLCFLESKGWLNGERRFLISRYDECMAHGGGFHRRVLLPLFFGTLNTPVSRRAPLARRFGAVPFLNGGLFAPAAVERRHRRARVSDEALGALFGQLLGAYRFTAREEETGWSEVAIDPEMLGRSFESLMRSRDRRASGAFYTPQPLVARVAEEALAVALARDGLAAGEITAALSGVALTAVQAATMRRRLETLTVLDPACGSGAFLVHLLERIADLLRRCGDARPLADIRRAVLSRTIHGVDLNPMAVWLCELRLWLSVIIESEERRMHAVMPLPNLECNVRVGDALAGEGFHGVGSLVGPSRAAVRLRERFARAAGPRKAPLRAAIARDERHRALAAIERDLTATAAARREQLLERRSVDLFGDQRRHRTGATEQARTLRARASALRRERRRLLDGGALPFSFIGQFGHVAAQRGFDLVVGNPPWVRLHNIPPAARQSLRQRFAVYRGAGWQPVFPDVAPTQGFGAQVDLAALFTERAIDLAAVDGTVALLLPAKLWRSLSGGALRKLIADRAVLQRLEDWTSAPCAFDAAVYPSVLIVTRSGNRTAPVVMGVRRRTLALEWQQDRSAVTLHADPASPWMILPRPVRRAFDAITERGRPLGGGALGRVTLGVKCGCNDAFLVTRADTADAMVSVEHRGRRGMLERALLRPLVRGDSLTSWRVEPASTAIVWTHDLYGAPLNVLPPAAARWLSPWKRQLSSRSDLRGARRWWSLFRTDGADCSRTRVVWGDFGRAPRAALVPAGDALVPLNSCYVLTCPDHVDALAFTALLNSPLAAAWLNAIAEPARGSWYRYLAWTVSLLPIPSDWQRTRLELAPLTERALRGQLPMADELLDAACRAYDVRADEVAPLIAWSH